MVESQFTNSLVKTMAHSLIEQAEVIVDEDPHASQRRSKLLRAASHMLNAFAELETMPRQIAPAAQPPDRGSTF